MMRLVIAASLVMLAIHSTPSGAQEFVTSPIHGTIRVIGGGNVPEMVRVTLESRGIPLREVFTSNGRFEFGDVPSGWYTLLVRGQQFDDVIAPIVVPSQSEVMITVDRKSALPRDSARLTSVLALQVPKPARKQFRIAEAAVNRNDCATAIDHLEKAIALFDKYAEAHNSAGNCYARIGKPELAEKSLRTAIELTLDAYPAVNLADLLVSQLRFDEADRVLTQAISRNPADELVYYGLAVLRFRQNRFDEAEQLAVRVHSHSSHTAEVHLVLAKIYQAQGKPDLVVREVRAYVKEAKPNPMKTRMQQLLADLKRNNPR